MAEIPYKLLVLQRLVTLLEGTTGVDHMNRPYDLRGCVYRGRTEFGEETTLPALSILEAPTPDIGVFAGNFEARSSNWVLLLQGWATDDHANPSDPAYWLAAATEARLGIVMAKKDHRPLDKEQYLLGGIITQLEVGPSVIRPLDNKASSRAFFYQPIRVGLAQYVGEPYRSA